MSNYDTNAEQIRAWLLACSATVTVPSALTAPLADRGYIKDDVTLMMSDDARKTPLRRHRNRTGQQSS